MKIEIDGQRYHTLDEASEITGLRQTTLQTYQRAEKGAIPPVSIKIGKELLLSEKFLSDILAKEEKRKSLEVKVGDWVFPNQREAGHMLGVRNAYISGWVKVEEAIAKCRKDGFVSEQQNSPVSVPKEEVVQTPSETPKVAQKPKIKVLVLGGQHFWTRWKAFLAKQDIELIGYESKYPKEIAVAAKVSKVDVVVVCQNMIGHGTYSKGKEICKKQGVPFELFKGFGNAVIKQAIDKAIDKTKDNK